MQDIPRAIRLGQAKCQIVQQIKTFFHPNKIQLIEAPAHDHRPIVLVRRLIQTIKKLLACIRTAARNHSHLKASINSIIKQLRICRHKTIVFSPFEAYFGRKVNTRLRNITTERNQNTLTTQNQFISNKKLNWISRNQNFIWLPDGQFDIKRRHTD